MSDLADSPVVMHLRIASSEAETMLRSIAQTARDLRYRMTVSGDRDKLIIEIDKGDHER